MAVTIQEPRGYPVAPLGGDPVSALPQAAHTTWVRRIVDVLNSVRLGKLNANLSITLRTSPNTTTPIIDARISMFSALLFTPQSAASAAMLSALYPSNQNNGSVTLNHLSTIDSCSYVMTIIG